MKNIEFLLAFEIELNKLDDNLLKPITTVSEYWLNAGLERFWKTRMSGINHKGEGFELTSKRIDDLRTLVTRTTYSIDDIISNVKKLSSKEYQVELPKDYTIMLGDVAGIAPVDGGPINECWPTEIVDGISKYIIKNSDTIEGTIDTIDRIIENSLSEYHLHYSKARPIRLTLGNYINLYTDGNYLVSLYNLIYLRQPSYINIHLLPYDDYADMPVHTHSEIVKLAVLMYLESLVDPRYQTYMNEVNSME